MNKKKDHAAWEKIKEWFQNLAAFLREMVSAYSGQSAQTVEGAKVAEFSSKILNQIEQIWAEGAVAAGESYQAAKENATDAAAEKNTTQGGEVMYMSRDIADVTEDTVRADLTDVFNGNNVSANSYIPISKTTPFALRYITRQMANLPMIVEKKKAYFDMRESGKFKEDSSHHYHGMGVDGFLKAMDILENPEYAIREEMKNGSVHFAFISTNDVGEEVCVVFQMGVTKPAVQMNGYPGGYYNLDITEFVATDEWLDEHGVEPGTSYKDYLLSFSENSIAYDRRFHLEQLEKARIIDSESAGLAASYDNNRASSDRVTQPDTIVKNESLDNTDVEIDTRTESDASAVFKSERTRMETHKDAVYLDAVNRGDMKTARRMVDEAARAAGYTVKAYHGTNADAFNVFDKGKFGQATGVGILGDGFYFTDSKKTAQKYGKNIYTVYLKQINPYAATDSDAYQLRSVSIERQGYDSVVLPTGNGNVYMVLEPEQIKSADPVTYDDNGDVIPLSERFNEAKTDIRYSDRDYSYDALVNKPDMVVTNVDGNVPRNRADVVYWAKQNAAKVGKVNPKDGSVSVRVDDIGADVLLGTKGLEHGLRRLSTSQTDPTWRITLKAGEIIKNAIRINEVTPSKEEASGAYVLIGTANNKAGDFYIVRFVVNQYSHELASMDVLYAINAKKEDRLRSMRPGFQGPVTDPKISIADLLDIVNQHFPDILPEDVLKHYGYDARPEGDLGQDALYQDRDTESVSNRALLANALEGLVKDDTERNKIQEYKGKIDLVNAEERKLRELNEQIKELSFAKGPRDAAKIRQLRDEATMTANRISIYDKQLLRLEASAPLQRVLERAYQGAEQICAVAAGESYQADLANQTVAAQPTTKKSDRESGKLPLATQETKRYSYRSGTFSGDVFPPYKTSHSDSHEVAERWSRSEEGKAEKRRLLSHYGKWYVIEVVDNGVYGYRIVDRLDDGDYKRRAKDYGKSGRYKSSRDAFDKSATYIRGRTSVRRTRSSFDSNQPGHRGENSGLSGVDEQQVQRGEIPTEQASTDWSSGEDRNRRFEFSEKTGRLVELGTRIRSLEKKIKSDRFTKAKKDEYRKEIRKIREEMRELSPDWRNKAKMSERTDDSVSNRALLANALEGLVKDETERTKIQEYKGQIDLVNAEERKLRELNEQIKELSFAKGPRDTAKIRQLRDEATKTANRISIYDKQLLRLEASAPLQRVLEREKKKAYQRAEKKGKEALAEYKAEAEAKQKETAEKWRESRKAAG